MMLHSRQKVMELLEVGQDVDANVHVSLDLFVFSRRELALFFENAVIDANLADVMEQSHEVKIALRIGRHAQFLAQSSGDSCHPFGVSRGVRILGIDRSRERAYHAKKQVFQVAVQPGIGPLRGDDRRQRAEDFGIARQRALVSGIGGKQPSAGLFPAANGCGESSQRRHCCIIDVVTDDDRIHADPRRESPQSVGADSFHLSGNHHRLPARNGDPSGGFDVECFAERRNGRVLKPFRMIGDSEPRNELVNERRCSARHRFFADSIQNKHCPLYLRSRRPCLSPFKSVDPCSVSIRNSIGRKFGDEGGFHFGRFVWSRLDNRESPPYFRLEDRRGLAEELEMPDRPESVHESDARPWIDGWDPSSSEVQPGLDGPVRTSSRRSVVPPPDLSFHVGPAGADARLDDRAAAITRTVGPPRIKPAVKLRYPAAGEVIGGFKIIKELGRGAFARVYLAEQTDLAGRPVALKVAEALGDEPQALARLQHTHIVPIHSVHDDPPTKLRLLCMPYFGGANLADVLHCSSSASAIIGQRPEPGGGAGFRRRTRAKPHFVVAKEPCAKWAERRRVGWDHRLWCDRF